MWCAMPPPGKAITGGGGSEGGLVHQDTTPSCAEVQHAPVSGVQGMLHGRSEHSALFSLQGNCATRQDQD